MVPYNKYCILSKLNISLYLGGIIIQKCIKCERNFPYIESLFSIWSFSGYKELKCKKCNTSLKITNLSRLIIGFLIALPLLIQTYIIQSVINIIVFYLIHLLCVILLSPLIVRYKLID